MPADKQTNAEIAKEGQLHIIQKLVDRGLVPELPPTQPPGVHLRFANASGSWHANIQVRTSSKKETRWPIGRKFRDFVGPDCFYVFLRLDPEDADYEVFLESAEAVAAGAERAREESLKRGNAEFPPWWELPKDAAAVRELREKWQWFGREEK